MKFTLSWLKRHLETNLNAEQISDALTSIGIEVEEIIDKSKIYKPFVISEIKEAVQHPNADKLKVCKVNNGIETLQIVCGAANAREGIKVVLAPVGAIIPTSQLIIKPVKIRGIESNGMLCSAEELGIEGDPDGIIELPPHAVVGKSYAEYAGLDDIIFDISITPNRGDIASVHGIARDLAAKEVGKLIDSSDKQSTLNLNKISRTVDVLEPSACIEFLLREVKGVDNKNKDNSCYSLFLKNIGFSQKNPLVKISNFTMLDQGRPNHIYDLDKINGNLTIRYSKQGENFIALGNIPYELPEGILIICDEEKVLSIAGVMGGELSKVDENTKNILIEVAIFDPTEVAKSGRTLNIISESRFRFERRVDCANSQTFMDYITKLVIEECKGTVSELLLVNGIKPNYLTEIDFDFTQIKKRTGVDISSDRATEILKSLGFFIIENKVSIPSYRYSDISCQEDLIEEILRIEGYNHIPFIPLEFSSDKIIKKKNGQSDCIRDVLVSRGLNELITWSFCSKQEAELFKFLDPIELLNPISIDLSMMRQSILPNMIKAIALNEGRSISGIGFFEIGHIYKKTFDLNQSSSVAGLRYGKAYNKDLFNNERNFDFYDAKADFYACMDTYHLDNEKVNITNKAPSYYHPGRSTAFTIKERVIGYAGELHPAILEFYNIKSTVIAFELFIEEIQTKKIRSNTVFNPINYQAVSRDLAFIVDEQVPAGSIAAIAKNSNKLIEHVEVFDVFKNPELGINKKSVAITMKIQPIDKTLEDSEINEMCNKIISEVKKQCDGILRE